MSDSIPEKTAQRGNPPTHRRPRCAAWSCHSPQSYPLWPPRFNAKRSYTIQVWLYKTFIVLSKLGRFGPWIISYRICFSSFFFNFAYSDEVYFESSSSSSKIYYRRQFPLQYYIYFISFFYMRLWSWTFMVLLWIKFPLHLHALHTQDDISFASPLHSVHMKK